MAFNKKPLKAQDKLIPYVNDLENRVDSEFTYLGSKTTVLQNAVGLIAHLNRGYGSGTVIDRDLTDQNGIYLLVTGRWMSMYIIAYDRGNNNLSIDALKTHERVTVTVTGENLKVNLDANGSYSLIKIA